MAQNPEMTNKKTTICPVLQYKQALFMLNLHVCLLSQLLFLNSRVCYYLCQVIGNSNFSFVLCIVQIHKISLTFQISLPSLQCMYADHECSHTNQQEHNYCQGNSYSDCGIATSSGMRQWLCVNGTLLIMSRYYNTTMSHYWDMSVKQLVYCSVNQQLSQY